MEEKNKKEKILNGILQIPFAIHFIFSALIIVIPGLGNLNMSIAIMSMCLLFISGYGLAKNSKTWNITASISIVIFTIWYGIMGYYDSIKWASTKIAIILLLFYGIVFFLKRKFKNAE